MSIDADLVVEPPSTTSRRGYDRDEVEQFVEATRSRLKAMADRLGQQQAEVDRLESENRSFSRSIEVAMRAAGEVMDEASATAEATMADAEGRAHELVESAEYRAHEILTGGQAEADELTTVGRADARAAVHDERQRIEAELEMIEALQRKVAKERQALVAIREQLTSRLLEASRYLANVAEDPLRAGQAVIAEALALTADDQADDDDEAPEAPEAPEAADGTVTADSGPDDSGFFSEDIEDDPARAWMLS